MRPGAADNDRVPGLPERLQTWSQNNAGGYGGITEHIAAAHRSSMIGGLCFVVV